MAMQKQKGFTDYGVFATATATSLCFKEDPTVVRWNKSLMRKHLLKCLENENVEPFPKLQDNTAAQGKTNKIITIDIHCICRQRHKRNEIMKQCNKCHQWFHQKCLDIEKKALQSSWVCLDCNVDK
jgi:hypothetical protein